jgi:hypothetical protein
MSTTRDMLDPQPQESAVSRICRANAYDPKVAAWLSAGKSDFARSLSAGLRRYGSLTERQMSAAVRAADEDAKPKAPKAAAVSVAGAGFEQLVAAFDRAKLSGLKYPAMTFDDVTFKRAGDSSKNAGCLYVTAGKRYGSDYYGKVSPAGAFSPTAACPAAVLEAVRRIGADPLGQVVAHGLQTGNCACCGRELTDPNSVQRGIGPICFERFFGG